MQLAGHLSNPIDGKAQRVSFRWRRGDPERNLADTWKPQHRKLAGLEGFFLKKTISLIFVLELKLEGLHVLVGRLVRDSVKRNRIFCIVILHVLPSNLCHHPGNFTDVDIYRTIEYTAATADTAENTIMEIGEVAQLVHESLTHSLFSTGPWIVA